MHTHKVPLRKWSGNLTFLKEVFCKYSHTREKVFAQADATFA